MIFAEARGNCSESEPDLENDPRFKLYPAWIQAQSLSSRGPPCSARSRGGSGRW